MIHKYRKIRPLIIGIITMYLILIISGVNAQGSASLFVSPSSGSFDQDFNIDVRVSSGGEEMNSVSGVISFPADKMRVLSISTTGSIVDTWIAGPTFSNGSGEVSYGGIMLNTPFQGSNGKVLTISFRPIATGEASISFSSASVLANDLIGTELLVGAGGGSYSLVASGAPIPEPEVEPEPEEEIIAEVEFNPFEEFIPVEEINLGDEEPVVDEEPFFEEEFNPNEEPTGPIAIDNPSQEEEDTLRASAPSEDENAIASSSSEETNNVLAKLLPAAPKVTSPTHPNPNVAYDNNNPTFAWTLFADTVGVNFLADQNPSTNLNEKSHGTMASYTYEEVADGEWYFHIRFQNESGWGNTTHRKFIIDTSNFGEGGTMAETMMNEEMDFLGGEDVELKSSAEEDVSSMEGDNSDLEASLNNPTKVKKDLWLKMEFLKTMPLTYITIFLLVFVLLAESYILISLIANRKSSKKKRKKRG